MFEVGFGIVCLVFAAAAAVEVEEGDAVEDARGGREGGPVAVPRHMTHIVREVRSKALERARA